MSKIPQGIVKKPAMPANAKMSAKEGAAKMGGLMYRKVARTVAMKASTKKGAKRK